MIKRASKPNTYQFVVIALLMLSACSSEPVSDNSNLADTSTIEQTTEPSTDAGGTADDDPNSENVDNPNTQNNIDTSGTDTPEAPIVQRIRTLVGRTLVSLNQSINQGQQLSPQQENCIGAFDPALGDSLLSIDCDQPLATGDVAIYMASAAFQSNEACHADLFENQTDACTVDYAELTVNTLWVQPTLDNGQDSRRPVPVVGASISYGMQPNVMTIENLPAALAGRFSCEFNIDTQLAVSGNQAQNCDQLLQDLVSLIDLHLS